MNKEKQRNKEKIAHLSKKKRLGHKDSDTKSVRLKKYEDSHAAKLENKLERINRINQGYWTV